MKGDHFVGKYYVVFDQQYKHEQEAFIQTGISKEDAEKEAPIFKKVSRATSNAKDKDVIQLQKMNNWVYEGFTSTYDQMGVYFDKIL